VYPKEVTLWNMGKEVYPEEVTLWKKTNMNAGLDSIL
jgi:hypothetical protein